MNIPTVSVQLLVSEAQGLDSDQHSLQTVSVDFSKESLNTMIDGLSKIKEQLQKMG